MQTQLEAAIELAGTCHLASYVSVADHAMVIGMDVILIPAAAEVHVIVNEGNALILWEAAGKRDSYYYKGASV